MPSHTWYPTWFSCCSFISYLITQMEVIQEMVIVLTSYFYHRPTYLWPCNIILTRENEVKWNIDIMLFILRRAIFGPSLQKGFLNQTWPKCFRISFIFFAPRTVLNAFSLITPVKHINHLKTWIKVKCHTISIWIMVFSNVFT